MMDSQDSLIAHQVPVTPLLLRDSRSNGVIFEVPSLQLSPYPTIPVVFKSGK